MTAMTPAELDALEARLRERAETWRDNPDSEMDVRAADAIRSLRAELAERDARIATALVALHRRELWVDTFDALDAILSWDRTR